MALSTISIPSTAGLADCDLAPVAARVAPATASEHLRKLVRGGLLATRCSP